MLQATKEAAEQNDAGTLNRLVTYRLKTLVKLTNLFTSVFTAVKWDPESTSVTS